MINIDKENPLLTAGIWAEFNGSKFLVSHMSNLAFQRALARRNQAHRRKIEQGTLDPAVARENMCHAMAEGLILDWKNVLDADNKEVPFSKESCLKALKNHEDLRDFVSEFAMNLENFRQEEKQEMGKS